MNTSITNHLKAVEAMERAESATETRQRFDDEDAAVAMNAVATITGRQNRQFFSAHDMKAARIIKATLQAIPSEASVLVQVAGETIAASPALDMLAKPLEQDLT